ncbi:hypothetical protein [Streptomyces brevispora]|uniref:hypothetical protein n=1 Tax=Streptomyces brevispora TaxID=887462 RepID=UPI00382E7341
MRVQPGRRPRDVTVRRTRLPRTGHRRDQVQHHAGNDMPKPGIGDPVPHLACQRERAVRNMGATG